MTPALHHFGELRSAVVTIDEFSGELDAIRRLAASLGAYPPVASGYYPGVRRELTPEDGAAWRYVTRTLEAAAPFIGGAFDADGFDLISASFSLVTTPPAALHPAQRAPHFDSVEPRHLAVMHYLSETPGTAFFRQRATGIERVDAGNVDRLVAAATASAAEAEGYIQGTDAAYEQIGMVAGHADRLVIYQGSLLHSGIIPPDLPLLADPVAGRLTANLFLLAR